MKSNKRPWTLSSILQVVIPIVILVPALWFAYGAMTTDMELSITLADEGIHVQHGKAVLMAAEDFIIPYGDIDSVEILDTLPSMHKDNGLNNSKVNVGEFTIEGVGPVKAYVSDMSGKQALVKTSTTTYILSPIDTDALLKKVGG